MQSSEPTIHSFIVKIWIEEMSCEDGEASWRGHITHVPSEERRYISRMGDIYIFLAPYLEKMGIRLTD